MPSNSIRKETSAGTKRPMTPGLPPGWPPATPSAPTICKTGCFCDEGYVYKKLWVEEGESFECVPEDTCHDGEAFCDDRGDNLVYVEDDCLDKFYCCHDHGSGGLCQHTYWWKEGSPKE